MRPYTQLYLFVILAVLMTLLCSCPLLNHKIFVRNLTADTARLTLITKKSFDTISAKKIAVRVAYEILPVKKKCIALLSETVIATVDSHSMVLIVPPNSTVFLSDILTNFDPLAEKSLVIESAGKSDTMSAIYPYKELQGFKRKLDPSYNYFYRTLVYYDIK